MTRVIALAFTVPFVMAFLAVSVLGDRFRARCC